MLTQFLSCFVHKPTAVHSFFQTIYPTFQESAIVVIRHKTNLITLTFLCQFGIAHIKCHLAYFSFPIFPKWHDGTAQQLLIQAPKYITLIFGFIQSFTNYIAPIGMLPHFGIMPCCNPLAAQGIGTLQQCTPFDVRITHHTRVWGTTSQIFLYKILYYKVSKLIAYIQYKMWESIVYSRLTGIVEAINIAATCFFATGITSGIIPGFHCNPNHFIPLIVQHQRRNGTINTATHCHQNLSFSTHLIQLTINCNQSTFTSKIIAI